MDIKGLKKALPICFEANLTMLIVGQHGMGKSQGVRQAIEGQNLGKVFDFRLGQMADTGDIIGLLDVESKDDFCTFKVPKRIYDVEQYCLENPDKFGVIFFDEMNRTTPDILQAIFQIVLDHELNGRKFPKNMKAVAAINPASEDYINLDFDDKAFNDRFCHVKFEPSVQDWIEYAKQQNVNPSITAFIGEHNDALENNAAEFSLQVEPSRRSWFFVDRIEKMNPDPALFQELLIGIVGVERASMYLDFLGKMDKTVKGIEILESYSKHRKKILEYSSVETNRNDILGNICSQIKDEFKTVEVLPKNWEKNFVNFICDIPKDMGAGILNDLFKEPAFLCTEFDKETGLAGYVSETSKKLIDHFENFKDEIKKGKSNE